MFSRDITMDDVKDVMLSTKATLWDALLATALRAKQILEEEEPQPQPLPQEFRNTIDEVARQRDAPPPEIRMVTNTEDEEAAARARAPPRSRKRKPAADEDEDYAAASKRSRRAEQALPLPLPLPQEFRNKIDEVARARNAPPPEVRMVIQKRLYNTDTTRGHNRLSIPIAQIEDDFLTADEKRRLDSKDANDKKLFMEVTILDPSLRTVNVKLSKWSMEKKNGGKPSESYVINGKWNDIVKKNGLEKGMIVQLWCFRVQQDLCFALHPA